MAFKDGNGVSARQFYAKWCRLFFATTVNTITLARPPLNTITLSSNRVYTLARNDVQMEWGPAEAGETRQARVRSEVRRVARGKVRGAREVGAQDVVRGQARLRRRTGRLFRHSSRARPEAAAGGRLGRRRREEGCSRFRSRGRFRRRLSRHQRIHRLVGR